MQPNMTYYNQTMNFCSKMAGLITNNTFTTSLNELLLCIKLDWDNFESLKYRCLKQRQLFIKQVKQASKGKPNEKDIIGELAIFDIISKTCINNLTQAHIQSISGKKDTGDIYESNFN